MGLCWMGHLKPGVLTISVILPCFNLLHLPDQHGHRPLPHQETRTHCLQLTNCLVFARLGCSHVNGRNVTNLPIEGCTSSVRSQSRKCPLGTGKPSPVPCKVSVTFPAKHVSEWATQEDNFIPKLMSLVIGNRLQRSACTIYPKHSCRNMAESQSSHRGKRRQIVAAQPGTQLISFSASSAGSTTPAACGAVPEKGHL